MCQIQNKLEVYRNETLIMNARGCKQKKVNKYRRSTLFTLLNN